MSLRAEAANLLLAFIRRFHADRVVYQSDFIKGWWQGWYGKTRVPNSVIYNGVDLSVYTPSGPGERPKDLIRIMVVEGSLVHGHEVGLSWAIDTGGEAQRDCSRCRSSWWSQRRSPKAKRNTGKLTAKCR